MSRYFLGIATIFFTCSSTVAMQKVSMDIVKNAAHEAILRTDLAEFKKIAASPGFDPNVTFEGDTLFHALLTLKACTTEFIKEIGSILVKFATFRPNIKNDSGLTPLMLLFIRDKEQSLGNDCLKFLFTSLLALPKLDLKVETEEMMTAIDFAPLSLEFIKPLVERGAQPDVDTFSQAKKHLEVYDYLIRNSDSAVFYAIITFDLALLRRVISLSSFKPHSLYKNNWTPVMFAIHVAKTAQRNSEDIFLLCDLLLGVRGTDINFCVNGYTAFAHAALAGVPYVAYVVARKIRVIMPRDYYWAEKEGAPGVFDFIKKQEAGMHPNSNDPHWQWGKRFVLPPGKYTYEESMKAFKDREHMDAEKKKCAHCNKPDCSKRCSWCKQSYYCSEAHQRADWDNHKKNFHQPKPCSICLEDVQDGKSEACGHALHENCLAQLKKNANQHNQPLICPECKYFLE